MLLEIISIGITFRFS